MPKTQYIQQKENSQRLFMKRGDILSEFFEISDKARDGGMGDVFFCRDKRNNKFYVLKTFRKIQESKDNCNLKNFDKEALASLQMPHLPYVVYTKTLIADGLRQYLVMDFIGEPPRNLNEIVQGKTLARVLESTKIEYKQSLIWAIEFCRGMHNLHKYGIAVHKDIKLDNILLASDNSIRITDFGLSVLDKKGGTKGYLPPEYSESSELTEQSDIYSFGIVLYQLFFNTCSVKIDKERVEKNRLLQKCLKTNPRERYQHFSDLEKDLQKELKQKFPKCQLEVIAHLTTTAEDYFFKGLGLYVLGFRQDKEPQLLQTAEKLLSKSIRLNVHNAAAYYYRSLVLSEMYPVSAYIITHPDSDIILDKEESKALGRIKRDAKYAQQYSAFYANLIELERYRTQNQTIPFVSFLRRFKRHFAQFPNDPYLTNNLGFFETKQRNYKKAIELFTKAIQLQPNYMAAYANRATVYLLLNQEEKALKDCAKYTQLQQSTKFFIPETLFYGIYVEIFRWYCWKKEYKKAYAWYEKHLDLFPNITTEQSCIMLSQVRLYILHHSLTHLPSNYDKKEVLKEYRTFWQLYKQTQQEKIDVNLEDWFSSEETQSLQLSNKGFRPKILARPIIFDRICITHPTASVFNEMGYDIAGWKHDAQGVGWYSLRRALSYFEKAIVADKTYAPAYYNLARGYQECKKYAKAISAYTKALELAPEQAYSCQPRCARYMQSIYEIVCAEVNWKVLYSIRKMGDLIPQLLPEKGHIQYSSHYIGEHLIVDTKYKMDSKYKNPIYSTALGKASVYFRLGKYNKALYYFKKAEQLGAPALYSLKGACFYKLKQYQEALNCFLNGLKNTREHTCSYANIALCYDKLGNSKKAKTYKAEAKAKESYILKILPGYFESRYKYCLEKGELFSLADLPIEDADGNLFVDNAYYQRAECYFALQNYKAALQDYAKVLHSSNSFPAAVIPKFILQVEKRITACEEELKLTSKK